MSRYGVDRYGVSFYGGPSLALFSAAPFTAAVTGYGTVRLSWHSPGGTWDELRLIRNVNGYPAAQDNGAIVYTATTGDDQGEYVDTGLPVDSWVYYTIFVHDNTSNEWVRAGNARAYSPRNYRSAERLYQIAPEIAKSETLLKYLSIVGFGLDLLRNDTNSLLDLGDANKMLYDLVPLAMDQFGIPAETELEPEQYRRFLRNAMHLYKTKGSRTCAHGVVSAVTGYDSEIVIGNNMVWDADSSQFTGSTGNWVGTAMLTWLPETTNDAGGMRIDPLSGTSEASLAPPVRVVAGDEYSASMKMRASGSEHPSGRFLFRWLDLNGTLLSTSNGPTTSIPQGVDVSVVYSNVTAPTDAALLEVVLQATGVASGQWVEVRQVQVNHASSVQPYQPGRDIRIYLDTSRDTDALRKAIHIARLREILPRYLPLGATFTLLDGIPEDLDTTGDDVVVGEDQAAVAPVGRYLTARWNDETFDAAILVVRWNTYKSYLDTFNRADNLTDWSGTGALAWAHVGGGTPQIVSNEAVFSDLDGSTVGMELFDSGMPDGNVGVDFTETSPDMGLVFRSNAAGTNYWVARKNKLSVYIGGVEEVVATYATAGPARYVATYSGSSIVIKRNGTTVASVTDSRLAAQTYVGTWRI